jgi:hypothetical protein
MAKRVTYSFVTAPRLLPSSSFLSCLNSSGFTHFVLFRERGDSASVSATVAALEDACTEADSFETICQIREDELDSASTREVVHHIRGEATPDEQALASFTLRKLI